MTNLKKIIFSISTLTGTIIGVGLFSLPYIASKVGFWVMLGYFFVLGILIILIHLFFGELALETPDYKRLPGFAKIYLGKWGEKVTFFTTIVGLFGVILAYLIVGGQFLTELLRPIFGGENIFYTLFYFALGASFIYFGIKTITKVEFLGLILFFLILILIFFRGKHLINIENLFLTNNQILPYFFLPYGAVLFSLWGATLIPEIEEILGEQKRIIKKIIPIAILIPIIVYLFFIYLILGITGAQTTESALIGLRNFLGNGIVSLGLFFGTLTTFTSFITLGLTLKKVFWYDLKIKKNLAWLITCFPPLILFFIGIKSFIPVICFVGGVMLGIEGILILLMYRKLQLKTQISKTKAFLITFLILILLTGVIYEIIYFIK